MEPEVSMFAQSLDGPLEHVLLGGGRSLDLLFGSGGQAGDGDELIVDLIHRAGTQDDLELSGGTEHTLHAVHVLQGFHVDLAVVHGDQPQAGGAVRRAHQVFPSAQQVEDSVGSHFLIHSHMFYSHSI